MRILFTQHTRAIIATEVDGSQGRQLSRREGPNCFVSVSDDPRLIQPLPWNYYGGPMQMFEVDGIDHSPVVMISQLFPIVLGGLVLPVWFLWTMVSRRRWSLQWFLLLPLVFVLPYVLFQLPSALGEEYGYSSTMPVWLAKLIGAIKLLPFLIFIAVFVRLLSQGQWKKLLLLTLVALTIPLLMVIYELVSERTFEGARYDWFDPSSLWLLWASVWAGGVAVALLWPVRAFWRLFARKKRPRLEPT